MIRWWRIMILGYKHRKFEYYTIHDQIIHIVDKAMKELSENQDLRIGIEEERRLQVRERNLTSLQGMTTVMEPSVGSSDKQESLQRSVLHLVLAAPQEP